MPEIPARPRLAPHVRLQRDRAADGFMLLHPEGAVELSETALAIVDLCDGSRNVAAIVDALSAAYDIEPGEIRPEVEFFLRELAGRSLIADTAA